jgi:hypothetical protein
MIASSKREHGMPLADGRGVGRKNAFEDHAGRKSVPQRSASGRRSRASVQKPCRITAERRSYFVAPEPDRDACMHPVRAGFWIWWAATVIDAALVGLVTAAIVAGAARAGVYPPLELTALLTWVVSAVVLIAWKGRTVGKAWCGLMVTSAGGTAIGLTRTLLRETVDRNATAGEQDSQAVRHELLSPGGPVATVPATAALRPWNADVAVHLSG